MSLVIIGLYHAYVFLKSGKKPALLFFFLFSTLGLLSKIPALSLFSALGIIVLIKEVTVKRKMVLLSAATASFTIACLWYFYWVPHLVETYHYELYFPKGIIEGIKEISLLLPPALKKFYFDSLHSYIAFICFVAGLFFIFTSKKKPIILGFGLVTMVFMVFIIKTGYIFPNHNYYIIPYTPVMAIVAGYFIARIPAKYRYILLCLIAIEGIANQQNEFFINENQLYKLGLEGATDQVTQRDDLIVINGGQNPQDIYFSHRKGWTCENEEITNPQFLDSLIDLGATYLIVDRSKLNTGIQSHTQVYQDEHYSIYSLKQQL